MEVSKASASPVRSLVMTVCRPGALLCARIARLGHQMGRSHAERQDRVAWVGYSLQLRRTLRELGAGGGAASCVHSPRPRDA